MAIQYNAMEYALSEARLHTAIAKSEARLHTAIAKSEARLLTEIWQSEGRLNDKISSLAARGEMDERTNSGRSGGLDR
jgi:hypothetical protein